MALGHEDLVKAVMLRDLVEQLVDQVSLRLGVGRQGRIGAVLAVFARELCDAGQCPCDECVAHAMAHVAQTVRVYLDRRAERGEDAGVQCHSPTIH